MLVPVFSPSLAVVGDESCSVPTSMTRSVGGGAAPIIKAKWEMNGPYASLLGTDDSTAVGAQFMPTGEWGTTKPISICAVVTDPDGMADINDGGDVYTDWYYPAGTAFHPVDPSHPDQIDGGTPTVPDYGLSGCGAMVTDENRLFKLSKTDGYNLFCNKIRTNNNNLPTFFDQYTYDEICSETGELQKETAFVYCADKQLKWEDPAGMYKVEVFAIDKAGVFSYEEVPNPDYNYFEYLPLTGLKLTLQA